MTEDSSIKLRIDENLKKEATALFADLGLDIPTAIRIFLKQAVKHQGLPFEVRQLQLNEETIAAMKEANRISKDPDIKAFTDVNTLFKELGS